MDDWKIYHNPNCSKSRKTLEILKENNIEPKIVEYLNDPPTPQQLAELVVFLGIKSEKLVRQKEELFQQLKPDLSNEKELFEVLSQNPKLIERPIVVKGNRAVLGRPPENVLELIGN